MSFAGLKYCFSSPANMFGVLAGRNLLNWMSDEAFLKRKFKLVMGQELDLDDPKTFNEKLQWLKLYDRKPLYTKLVDKYAVREYIAEKIGEEYLIPLVGGPWNSPDEIDFAALPDQFVLKCTHDSGGVIICKDKSALDIPAAKAALNKHLKHNYYWTNREWPYKDVPPRIIAEKYMEDETGELRDFKFLCFNGRLRTEFICTERYTETGLRVTFFDEDWNRLPFIRHYPSSEKEIPRPESFEEMKRISELLSEDMAFARIDFYEVSGEIYLGEITLYPGSGLEEFDPPEWDERIGSWLTLPAKK